MSVQGFMSKSEFAAYIGRAPSYITWLLKNDRLVMCPAGKKVLVSDSLELIRQTADPSKFAVAERHEGGRVARGVTAHVKAGASATEALPTAIDKPAPEHASGDRENFLAPDFQKARAHREHFLALLAEDEYLKQHGRLVEVGAVENAAFATGRMLRDLLLGLPKQIAPEIAAISDPWEVERLITAGIRRVLEDADRVSASDLEDAIKPAN